MSRWWYFTWPHILKAHWLQCLLLGPVLTPSPSRRKMNTLSSNNLQPNPSIYSPTSPNSLWMPLPIQRMKSSPHCLENKLQHANDRTARRFPSIQGIGTSSRHSEQRHVSCEFPEEPISGFRCQGPTVLLTVTQVADSPREGLAHPAALSHHRWTGHLQLSSSIIQSLVFLYSAFVFLWTTRNTTLRYVWSLSQVPVHSLARSSALIRPCLP